MKTETSPLLIKMDTENHFSCGHCIFKYSLKESIRNEDTVPSLFLFHPKILFRLLCQFLQLYHPFPLQTGRRKKNKTDTERLYHMHLSSLQVPEKKELGYTSTVSRRNVAWKTKDHFIHQTK